MAHNQNPIGFFDSGVGGTSVWKAVHELLPYESTIYVADSANAPYGERSSEEILALSIKNTEFLISKGCKLIVVACNTATTNAIKVLRSSFELPFVGIEPAIKPASLQTKTGKVGLLATKGTLGSVLFNETVLANAAKVTIYEQEGTGLVPLIEAGLEDGPQVFALLKQQIAPMLANGIDTLVLGCTHYPYLVPALLKILPSYVSILDSALPVALQTQKLLLKNELQAAVGHQTSHEFYTNKEVAVLSHFLPKDSSIRVAFTTQF